MISVVGILIVGGLVGVGVILHRYTSADHLGVLDDPAVINVADPACEQMARSVRDAAPAAAASPTDVATAIRVQDAAITMMVAKIRAVGSDRLQNDQPATAWLADWERLVGLREAFADELAAGGHPTLVVPQVDGARVTIRMDEVGLSEGCAVADELAHPASTAR
ncbi:hypothetical protein [Nocardioides sp. AN3]